MIPAIALRPPDKTRSIRQEPETCISGPDGFVLIGQEGLGLLHHDGPDCTGGRVGAENFYLRHQPIIARKNQLAAVWCPGQRPDVLIAGIAEIDFDRVTTANSQNVKLVTV